LLQCLLLKPGKIELQEVATPAPSDGELLIRIGAAGESLKCMIVF
jgi:NADPH:quinone reductase-like Zn-dependent oxidoreductase